MGHFKIFCVRQPLYKNLRVSILSSCTTGVPQGSVLGPLFYILYANDRVELFKDCKVALYADETVLYKESLSFGTSVDKMQLDLKQLSKCCEENGIMVNTSEKSKTK